MYKRPLIALGLILLVIIGGILIFNIPWGGNADRPLQELSLNDKLVDYADTNVKTRMIISGDIRSRLEHNEVVVTVGHDSVVAQVIEGYEGDVIRSRRYSNTEAAYRSFLAGLKAGQFVNLQTTLNENYLGSCPLGQRYYFEMYDSTETVFESWATSCSKRDGTFDGELSTVRTLFRNQVPDYQDLTKGLNL
jgi:hypothetical protein